MPGQTSPTSPSWSASIPTQPFHFRLRLEPLDWRRMAALDVDRVQRETDINMLQDFIGAVTFCAVEGERCPQCRSPIDTTLLNVLRMSQYSTEYLLHCQDYLSSQVAALEGQLQAAQSEAQQEKEERARLEKEMHEVKQESRRRKKLIATQQLLLQSSASNYHKCQFCEKYFVNYSYLQSHVQRRHPEIIGAEKEKKMQVEQMKDGLEELKEKLRLTQSQLEAEREADAFRRQQELEEQRRRVASDREMIERSKEEEKRTFQDEISGLRLLFQHEFEQIKSKSVSIEAKLHELEIKEKNQSNLKGLDESEKDQRMLREREMKKQLDEKMNKWKIKMKELQNRHQQEKEKLESENNRLQKALFVGEGTSSSVLTQQVLSLSSQLREKETLIHSQKKKIKELMSGLLSESLPKMAVQSFPDDEEDFDDEKEEILQEVVAARLETVKGVPAQRKNFRSIVKKRLQKRLEIIGLRRGTKGISAQTLRSLIYERGQKFRSQSQLQDLRHNLEEQLKQNVRERQRSQGKATPSPHMLLRKKLRSTPREQSPRLKQFSPKPSIKKLQIHQTPTAAPRSKAPTVTPIRPAQQKTSTPPFSSEEEDSDESGEDSAYITSSRDKPSTSVHLTPKKEQQRVERVLDWSDSDDSDTQKPQQAFNAHGSAVEMLSRSLEKQMSSSITHPVGGIRVLPPASQPHPRPAVTKQQAVSEEESDLDLSSIEELTAPSTAGNKSLDVGVTSGTSVWSSLGSRAGAW